MANKAALSIWYDREADFLEVIFERKPGFFRQTSHDQVMEKVDKRGRVIGFHILNVREATRPVSVHLVPNSKG